MLVSFRHRLVLLSMPKCASTSLEKALAGDMDVVISQMPAAKHTPYRKYERFLRRYFETFTDGPLEVVSLFREPVDWLHSWWRYRGRAGIPDASRSARGMSFSAFVDAYLADAGGPAAVGSQARFVSDKDEALGVDHLFRHENLPACVAFLEERLGREIALDRLNVSPAAHGPDELSDAQLAKAREGLAREYDLWERVAR